ncbi:hypothetical protein F4823DRAFT_560976 [Ustulina deusta]|nr:hypothetical protein F4823DRAFT_560976 [Ustulina deusta]
MRTPDSRQPASAGSGSEANRWNELKETIDAIETCGEFATKKQYSQYANPGLQIGDALIALPLDPAQVTLIRDASRQAPFGRGDKTLIDTSVRNTWELDASKFHIANPAWSTFVGTALQHVSQSLGMSGVKTELYKLLLYEKGSFFKRHKDSEKAPGMIATLSICLPSRYKGGEVHLSHAGKNRVFDTGQSIFDVSALAWYADVTHEIKPILEGHRLVLIYNIIQTGDGATSADFLAKQDKKLHSAITKLHLYSPPPKRLLYILDHKYSQTSLRVDHLKGRDRAVGQTLQEACTMNGYYMFLCNVTKRSSDDDYDYDGFYNDDEDRGPELAMDTVTTRNGQIFASNVELDKRDILGPDPYSKREADSESEGEETGNEGAAMEYRYHDSAALIVHKGQLHQFFGSDVEIKVLLNLVMDDLKAHPKDPATRGIVTDFLSKVVEEERTMSPLVLTSAWRMKEDNLFRTAVRAGFKNGVPGTGVVHALVGIVKSAPAGPINWDKSFGEFMSSHRSLVRLSQSLDLAKSLLDPGDMQTSFQQWRSTMELLNFEGKKSLGIDDHDSIVELAALQWENATWVGNTLLPKIRDCSDKKLLSKFICSLLEKGREGVLDGAQDKARVLLESGIQKLYLSRIKFNSMAGDYDDWSECERFCQLLDNCLLSGLQQPANELLRLSLDVVKSAPRNDGSSVLQWDRSRLPHCPILAEEMLRVICQDFETNKMSPSEPARDFVLAVLKKFVLSDLPKCPRPPRGYSHQKRGCGSCKHCEELDAFLVSQSEQERAFQKGPRICSHLVSQLPSNMFRCTTTESPTYSNKPQFTLTVFKLNHEYQMAMDNYMKDLRQVLHKVRPFRTEYLKELLGASAYDEFVMLEKLPHSGDVELESGGDSLVSRKRRARGSIKSPAAKR